MDRFVRYGFYPLTLGLVLATAWAVAGGAEVARSLLPAVFAAAIAAIALFERRLPFEPAWLVDQGDLRTDIVHALVNWGLLSTGGWVTHALALSVLGPTDLWPAHWPAAAQLLLVALVVDFALFAMHWLSHRWPWAWRLHAVHHSAERLYWLNGERRHPASALLMGGPGLLLLAGLGAPPELVSAWLAVIAVHLAFQHANLDYRLGPLRRWIAGAETHRWHHKREYEDAQVNFGEVFLVWDRLFGTFLDAGDRLAPGAAGLRGRSAPPSYLRQLTWPFQVPPSLRDAFEQQLDAGRHALDEQRPADALTHFEAAHILGQSWTGLHVRSHLALLRWGIRAGRPSEIVGQALRVVAAAAFTWLWVPTGNPGSTRVNAFDRRPISNELAEVLAGDRG